MNLQRPTLEQVRPGFGSSFTVKQFDRQYLSENPIWHFHPEYEIVYISDGRGKRHIGDHQSWYSDGDLIVLGPNLPHFGFTHGIEEKHIEIVVQMKPDFLGKDFFKRPEAKNIDILFERASSGISFQGSTKQKVGDLLVRLNSELGFRKLRTLLEILDLLANSKEYQLLQANGPAIQVNSQEQIRIENIYKHVQEHFAERIKLEEMSSLVNMTTPAFCRYFKKITNMTFTRFVNEYRIGHACKLLMESDESIGNISDVCGFNNLSHFNKQFKMIAGQSPKDYRTQFKKMVINKDGNEKVTINTLLR